MPTAPSIPDTCPHERRPGLTVCLHCRHAAREAEAERRRRTMSRAAVVVGAVVIGITIAHAALRARVGTALAAALARVTTSATPERAAGAPPTLAVASLAGPAVDTVAAPRTPAPAVAAVATRDSSAPADTSGADSARPLLPDSTTVASVADTATSAPAAPAVGVERSKPMLAPVVPQGRSELPEGMSVVRSGDSLTVHFDTELGRTRRPEKFERIVRATLPALYGRRAAAALAGVREGEIARAGDLLTELPARGVRIPSSDGWTLVVRPETRPGRDGPIVVRYVATVER